MSFDRRQILKAASLGPLLFGHAARAQAPQPATRPYRLIMIRDTLGFGHTGSMAGPPAPHRLVPPKARDAMGVPLAPAALPALPGDPTAREVKFTGAADLPPSLLPLRRWWQSTLILDRFYNPYSVDLHGNGPAMYRVVPASNPDAPSIMGVVAARLSTGLPFGTVAMDHKGDSAARYFDRFLGSVGSGGDGLLQQRRAVLGAVRAQAARLSPVAGKAGKEDLDRYLAGLTESERSLAQLASWKCEPLPARHTETDLGQYDPIKPLISHAQTDIGLTAMMCGLTRVVSLNFIPGRGPFQFFDPNPNDYNLQGALGQQAISTDTRYADLTEGLTIESAATGAMGSSGWTLDRHDNHHSGFVATLTAIDRWEAALVARMIEKLQATPEPMGAGGTMWDHTLIVWTNSGGGIHHYGVNDHAVIVIGGPGICGPQAGARLRTGRYVSYPKKARSMADLYVSMANAVGVDIKSFGDPSVNKGPLPGLGG